MIRNWQRRVPSGTRWVYLAFLLLPALFSASANLLWSPVNVSSNPFLTTPGRIVLAWQLPGPNLIVNGDFELPPTNGWTIASSEKMTCRWLTNSTPGTSNGRISFVIQSSQQTRLFASISQVVSIPDFAEGAILSWKEQQTFLSSATIRLEIRSLDDTLILSQPVTSGDFFSGILYNSADLSRFIGQTVRIVFVAEGLTGSTATLDDVRLAIGPVADAEFDVYLGPTANLNASHLLGQTTEFRWDITDVAPTGANYWRVDVRSKGQVAKGAVWNFFRSNRASTAPSELVLLNSLPDAAVNEGFRVDAILNEPGTLPALQPAAGTGRLSVGVAVAGHQSPSICITELQYGSTNAVEFMNVSTNEIDISGWNIILYVSSQSSGFITNSLPQGTKVAPGEIFLLLPGSPAPGSYPILRTGRSNSQSLAQAVHLVNAEGRTVDFVHVQPRSTFQSSPTEVWVPPASSVENWIGPAAFASEPNRSLLRVGNRDRNDRDDWTVGLSSLGVMNTGLTPVFEPGVAILEGTLQTLTNSISGTWGGTNSSSLPATNAYLVARHRTFNTRLGPFDITLLPQAQLILPGQIAENQTEPLFGVLRLRNATDQEVRATPVSDYAGFVFPEPVIIPAGSQEASFPIVAVNNDVLSGPVRVRVWIESEQIQGAATILVTDDEKPGITLTAASEIAENSSAEAVVHLDAPLPFDLEVQISTDLAPALIHPASVVIPAGQTNAAFPILAPNDPYFSGPKQVTLRVHVPGWPIAGHTILVSDDEPQVLTATPSSTRYPETFYQLNAFTISLGGIAATDIPLTIESSDRSELAPATNAVIRAGNSSVTLGFHLLGDDLRDGTQPVTLTVSSPGFEPVMVNFEITDDDPATFEVSVSSATKYQGVPFTVGFRAIDINGQYIDSFAGAANLTASNNAGGVAITPSETGPFAAWGTTAEAKIDAPGELFWIAAEFNGAVGTSAPFRLLPSPLHKKLDVATCDLKLTSDRSNLVATVSDSDPTNANRILIIDPRTAEITRTIPTRRLAGPQIFGSRGVDGQLALSSDGSSIFIITEDGTMVQQFAWDDGTLIREFGLGTNELGETKIASTIQAIPEKPDRVAIAQVDGWNALTTRIYDQGTPLPNSGPFALRMMFSSPPQPSYLSSHGSLWSILVGDTGFTEGQMLPKPGGFPFWNGGDTQLRDGLIHFTTGVVYDPLAGQFTNSYPVQLSHYPRDLIGTFDFDSSRNRVFFITPRANGGQMLDVFDIPSRQWIRRIELGMISGYVPRLYHLGDSLAAMDITGIYFLRSSMFNPMGAPVEIHVSREATNLLATSSSNFTYSLVLTNLGTNTATEITVDETFPTGISLISALPGLGRWERSATGLRWIVDDLPAGTSASIQITINAAHGGIFNVDTSLATYEWNAATNTFMRTALEVQLGLPLNAHGFLPLGATSLTFDQTRNLIYASIGPALGPFGGKIAAIEPASGRIVQTFDAGPLPTFIAVSAHDKFLWAIADDRRTVRRFLLPSMEEDLEFKLLNHPPTPTFSSPIYDTAVAIEPIPGQPASLAILQLRIYEGTGTSSGGIAIYDDGDRRHYTGSENGGSVAAGQVLINPAATKLFGPASFNSTLEYFQLDGQGVHIQERLPDFQAFGHPAIGLTDSELIKGDGTLLDLETFAPVGHFTNATGDKMIKTGASSVTIHPGKRVSFIGGNKIYFADLNSRLQLGSVDLPLGQDYPVETLAINDQLVFLLSSGTIYFVRSEHLATLPPEPVSIEALMAGGALIIRTDGRPGLTYQLQVSEALSGEWMNLGEPKTHTGTPLEFPTGQPAGGQSFFRVKID